MASRDYLDNASQKHLNLLVQMESPVSNNQVNSECLTIKIQFTAHEEERKMRTISDNEARQNLSAALRQTAEDRIPILITQQNGQSCVLMSLEEYNAREETAYLMQSPENARQLLDAIESLKTGKGLQRELME